MLYYPRLGVIYLKRHKPYVTTDQYGRVRRDYGNGPYLSVIKDKNGNHTEKIYDDQGLRSCTFAQAGEATVTRFVRVDYPDDYPEDAPLVSDAPRRTPRLAGPKGHIP